MPNVPQAGFLPLVIDNGDGTCTPIVATADTVIVTATQYYDVSGFLAGEPGSEAIILQHVVARAFDLPDDLADSQAVAGVAADGTAVASVTVNGVEIGTITWAPAGVVGTFAATDPTSLSVGDILAVIAPTVPDADLADISVTLFGTVT